jgi:Transposase DDE domain group 1
MRAGKARDDAQVAELTGQLRHGVDGDRLAGWPADLRILVRREKIEHGTQLSLFEDQRLPHQLVTTTTRGAQVHRLEARHRVHARMERFIRCGKDTGLARWPSQSFAINTAWVTAVALAIDLLCRMRLLLLEARWPWPNRHPRAPGCCPLQSAWSNDSATRSKGPRNMALGKGRRRHQPRPRYPLSRRLRVRSIPTKEQPPEPVEPGLTARHTAEPLTRIRKSRSTRDPSSRHGRTRATVKCSG